MSAGITVFAVLVTFSGQLVCLAQGNGRPASFLDPRSGSVYAHNLELLDRVERPAAAASRNQPNGPAGTTISVTRLGHHFIGKAIRNFNQAQKLVSKGDRARALAALQRAVAIDPDFYEAHNDLGVLSLQERKADTAVKEFRRCIELDARDQMGYTNLGFAYFALQSWKAAEAMARAALHRAPECKESNLLLGCSLLAQGQPTAEARKSLEYASSQFPQARMALVVWRAKGR